MNSVPAILNTDPEQFIIVIQKIRRLGIHSFAVSFTSLSAAHKQTSGHSMLTQQPQLSRRQPASIDPAATPDPTLRLSRQAGEDVLHRGEWGDLRGVSCLPADSEADNSGTEPLARRQGARR